MAIGSKTENHEYAAIGQPREVWVIGPRSVMVKRLGFPPFVMAVPRHGHLLCGNKWDARVKHGHDEIFGM